MRRETVNAKHNLPARRIFAIANAGKRGPERYRICKYEKSADLRKIQEEISRAPGNAGAVKRIEEIFKITIEMYY